MATRTIRVWNLETDVIENMEIEEEFLQAMEAAERDQRTCYELALEAERDNWKYVRDE
jgi:hypothetical protein